MTLKSFCNVANVSALKLKYAIVTCVPLWNKDAFSENLPFDIRIHGPHIVI